MCTPPKAIEHGAGMLFREGRRIRQGTTTTRGPCLTSEGPGVPGSAAKVVVGVEQRIDRHDLHGDV